MIRALSWLLFLLLAALPAAGQEPSSDDDASVLVSTVVPAQGKLVQPVTAYGTAQPASNGSLAVSSLHAAQVMRLRIVAGQTVTAGEPLLDLSADPSASLAYAQAVSDLKLARGELARTRQMLAQHLATNSQVEQSAKAAADAEATVKAREREGGGKPVETVNAPSAGVVATLSVSNGDHVQPGATLLDIGADTGMTGVLGIASQERRLIKPGQAVTLVNLDAPAVAIGATVASVGGLADPKTGLFSVIVRPADADAAQLTAGAHLRATISTDGVAGWILPRGAVLTDDEGPYVFQVADGKARRVAVQILAGAGDKMAVSGPIDPKEKLVASGNYQLSNGAAVREMAGSSASAAAPSK